MKKYYYQRDVGSSRYVVSYYDGEKTHADGSEFYDIAIMPNKKDMQRFITKLKKHGYVERF